MTEAQRTILLLSMPACADISQAMEEFTDITYISSEQHKVSTSARMARDASDMTRLWEILGGKETFSG